ncbi:hypothetical protein KSF_004820 [Reticulibacter mediterranei]|uniref:HTH luxR-type domain-containing protein n=1 Tax=Reticulibacter mediterranei TaxID=2778369 RepID=A0A8J3I7U0_9CHLR|nr:LuxR C-terminal-related transcriptional regulator [Reticulibacter mediterranei]GHO90434.1 hypothetical protein KSF_004820 [Reticulibacter mediterranei]
MPEPDLIITKFTIPPVRPVALHRPHLLTILNQSYSIPFALISAGAGFGKTTLLSTWACQSTSQVAWLTLDEHDNDPTRFWTYVIAALRKACSPPIGETTLTMLYSLQPPGLRVALTPLINELAALSQDTVLILDDYHLIHEQTLHDSLQFLLDHLPASMHLLLASRADPPLALSRLRAKRQIIEVRETGLRLCGEESARFLKEVMDISLSAEEVAHLEKRTEGWITGFQLAALSLHRHTSVSAFLQAFTGNHRLVRDYVQEEILEPLPKEQQQFLLHTSVLERMNAETCQSLTGEQDSQQMLEALERANLFLVPLDEERYWYRFHTLFREVLLARLQATQPEQVPILHRKAALWYHQQGWLHEALSHATASQDFWFVAELLEGYTERLYLQGELKTLLTWIKHLPQEVLHAHPRLATSYILAFNMLSPFTDGVEKEYLNLLWMSMEQTLQNKDQAILTDAERDRLHHRMMILQVWKLGKKALSDGNVEQLNSLVESLQHLSLDDDVVWRQQLKGGVAMTARLSGKIPIMVAALQEIREMTRMAPNHYQEVQTLWGLITALIASGQLRLAHEHCQEFQQLVDHLGGPLPIAAYPDLFQAQLAYSWNQLERANSAAQRAIEKTAPMQYLDILMEAYEVTARCCMAQGDLTGAEDAVRQMESLHQSVGTLLFRSRIESLWVHLWLAQGNLTRAIDWAEHTSYRREFLVYNHESASLSLVRVLVAEQRYSQALQMLDALLEAAKQEARLRSLITVLSLYVATLQAAGATHEALQVLDRLLAEAEPEGEQRVFLDVGEPMHQILQIWLASHIQQLHGASPTLISYAQTLLAGFANEQRPKAEKKPILIGSSSFSYPPSQAVPLLAEPLTPREQEVLCLLAQGASNQEIATRLVISLRTVKKHVSNLLLKLMAQNRTHAVARARELSLL